MGAREGGPKLCKDCKYIDPQIMWNCTKVSKGRSLVNGRIRYEDAGAQRSYPRWWIWRCGPYGRFWEQREWKSKLEMRLPKLST